MNDSYQDITPQNGGEMAPYGGDDYEIVQDGQSAADYGNQAIDMLQQVTLMQDKLNTGMTLAQNVGDMYRECLQLHDQRKMVEAKTKVELAKTVAQYKLAQDFITKTFSERAGALQEDYKVLDDAIARGDRDMILAAMGKIGDIVTTSPLAQLRELCERFDDPDDSLLDF